MTWTGVSPQTLLWALAIGAAALLLLFFLRPRPQLLAVPSHVLWKQVIPRRLDPLIKEIIALVLQLIILAAVIAALGAPQRVTEEPEAATADGIQRPRDRVVVVDLSASMAALEGDASRLQHVKERLESLLFDLAEGERLAIVRAGQTASVAVPLTDDVQRLGLGIRSLRVRAGRADLEEGVREALTLVSELRTPSEIRVFADSLVGDVSPPEGCSLVFEQVGSPGPNVAVTAFDVRATEGLPAKLAAFVEVTNYAPLDAAMTVSIETPTRVLGRASYELPAGTSMHRVYHFFPPDEDRVEVVLQDLLFEEDPTATDVLAIDDHAYAFLPGLRPARVLMVSRGNRYLETALNLIPGLRLDKVTPGTFQASSASSRRYDLVFFDSFVPESLPRVNSFFINPPVAVAGFSLVRRIETPVTTSWKLGHPLFANLVLRDLHIAVSGQFEPGKRDVRLIETPTGPIALAKEDRGIRRVVFGFDFADSDLPLRVAFPQLVFNAVLWMREGNVTTPPAGPAHLARDPMWIVPAEDTDSVLVEPLIEGEGEGGRVRSIPTGDGPHRHFFERVGFHTVGNARDVEVVAVSVLDPLESDLSAVPQLGEPPAMPPAPEPEPHREPVAPPWFWLGLVAVVLLIGEFGVVNR